MSDTHSVAAPHVVIVGGGIAALETVLALHELAGDRVRVTMVAPEPEVVLRPLTVARPFGRGHVNRLALEDVMAEHDGRFVRGAALRVDAPARVLTLATGTELAYDALVLAQGVTEVPAFAHAMTFGEQPDALNGILADLEEGYTHSVAFVVPAGCTWPLPLYELALMTAEEVWSMGMDRVALHLVTPEAEPLEIFGTEGSAAVAELLRAAGITVHLGVAARIEQGGHVDLGEGAELTVDRVVALPVLEGRRLPGVPCDANGFVPVDDAGVVDGIDGVYAVGDVTDRPVKQGGLACQQADVTAAHIAARAGADVTVPPLEQVLRGRLLTGERDRFLRRPSVAGAKTEAEEPLWWPSTKVSGKHLSPYLTAKGVVHLPPHATPRRPGIDVRALVAVQPRDVAGGATRQPPLRAITPLAPALTAVTPSAQSSDA